MGRRLDWIDYAKGLIIVELVFGHSMGSSAKAGVAISQSFLDLSYSTLSNLIPLFFFLAGVFVPKSYENRGTRSFLAERLQRLVYPYFVWSVLQATAAVVMQPADPNAIATLLAIPYQPFDQFWFLYALVWMAPIYVLTRQFGRASSLALAAVAIALFVFPFRTIVLGLEMLSVHLIFFAAGALLSRFVVGERQLPDVPVWATLVLTAAFFGSSIYIYTHWLDASTGTAMHGEHRHYYLFLGVLGGIATTGWSQLLARKSWLRFLQLIGKYSLQIFVAHMFGVVGFRVIAQAAGVTNPFLIIAGCMAAGIVSPIVLAVLIERFGLPSLFELRTRRPRAPTVKPEVRAVGHDR